ncbi:hypothetical protein C0Q70_02657 [Pomacea canaliculata]|uniref:Nose resistant-to-fluoxetine protein N-terminal domain-containing protein n=1 Tax=Pomacea canaliculata TaxID=400727 RepID=A0A2T7PQJ5_POMCA|nr:hypothetical protein C0Q70_02657 [Pomacea canaliculata]
MGTSNDSILNLINAFSQNGSFDFGAILSSLSGGGSISSLLGGVLQSQLANLPQTFSPQCLSDIEEFQNGLNRLDTWTIEMLDAMGKPQAGMLKGQKTFAGQYDECREISYEMQSGHVIQGQFCTPQVMLDFSSLGELASGRVSLVMRMFQGPLTMLLTPLYVDMCLPASCTDADVFVLFESPVENLGAKLTAASCVKDKDPTTDAGFWFGYVCVMMYISNTLVKKAFLRVEEID